MKTEAILAKLNDRKGASLNVRLVSGVATLAAHKDVEVFKVTEMTVISGVSFENRRDIRDAIEAGERSEVGALPWGQWKNFPFVIEHKGNDYIRLYLPSKAQQEAGFARETTVQFIANGKPITRDEAIQLCGSKAKARENEEGCLTVKAAGLEII